LPLVIIDFQRGGPSTGLPTKTEQTDLLQALYGRHGEAPLPVLSASSPADCFDSALEACRIAIQYMTPVILMSDTYITNGTEPWKIPDVDAIPPIVTKKIVQSNDTFSPYKRDENLVRPWAIPGIAGLEHRVGGLEKQNVTGNVSYDPINHETMVRLRAQKIAGIAREISPTEILGAKTGKVLVIGWGSTYGAIRAAVEKLQQQEAAVSAIHLRYLNPLPPDITQIAKGFEKVLVPELNLGQLHKVLRAEINLDSVSLTKVQGVPFKQREIIEEIQKLLKN
jgi:2-oxoglutarate ferredoxin oxidoreductase subunit alpha